MKERGKNAAIGTKNAGIAAGQGTKRFFVFAARKTRDGTFASGRGLRNFARAGAEFSQRLAAATGVKAVKTWDALGRAVKATPSAMARAGSATVSGGKTATIAIGRFGHRAFIVAPINLTAASYSKTANAIEKTSIFFKEAKVAVAKARQERKAYKLRSKEGSRRLDAMLADPDIKPGQLLKEMKQLAVILRSNERGVDHGLTGRNYNDKAGKRLAQFLDKWIQQCEKFGVADRQIYFVLGLFERYYPSMSHALRESREFKKSGVTLYEWAVARNKKHRSKYFPLENGESRVNFMENMKLLVGIKKAAKKKSGRQSVDVLIGMDYNRTERNTYRGDSKELLRANINEIVKTLASKSTPPETVAKFVNKYDAILKMMGKSRTAARMAMKSELKKAIQKLPPLMQARLFSVTYKTDVRQDRLLMA